MLLVGFQVVRKFLTAPKPVQSPVEKAGWETSNELLIHNLESEKNVCGLKFTKLAAASLDWNQAEFSVCTLREATTDVERWY